MPHITKALENPFNLTYTDHTLSFILILTIAYLMCIAACYTNAGKRRIGEEYSSAVWVIIKLLENSLDKIKKPLDCLPKCAYELNSHKHQRNLTH